MHTHSMHTHIHKHPHMYASTYTHERYSVIFSDSSRICKVLGITDVYVTYFVFLISNHYRMPCSIPTGLSYIDSNQTCGCRQRYFLSHTLSPKTHSQTSQTYLERNIEKSFPGNLSKGGAAKMMRLESVDLQLQAFRKRRKL